MIAGIADALCLRGIRLACCGRSRGIERLIGNFEFGNWRATSQVFDRTPVQIACRKIHRGKGARRAQPLIDQAHALEQLYPVDVGHQTHAGDDIAHRDGGRALSLLGVLHHVVDRSALMSEPFLQPAERRHCSWILASQPFCELRSKAFPQRPKGTRGDVRFERGSGIAGRE